MLSWKIGDVTITRLVEQEFPVVYSDKHPFMPDARPEALEAIPWLYPHYVTDEGYLRLSIHALLVDAPGLRLVVDTCVGNDRPRRMLGGRALSTGFLEGLAQAGWSREGVDAVVCTHLHVDHVGWNTMLAGDDAIHHPCQMAHPQWTLPFDSDPQGAVATRTALLEEFADQPILFIGTHFAAPTAGRVTRDGRAYRLEGWRRDVGDADPASV